MESSVTRSGSQLTGDFYVAIRLSDSLSDEELLQLEKRLTQIMSDFDVELIRPAITREKRSATHRRIVLDHLRFDARIYVEEAIAMGSLPEELKQEMMTAPLGELVKIDENSDEKDIKRILTLVGKGNKFRSLHAKAREAAGPSPKTIKHHAVMKGLKAVEEAIAEGNKREKSRKPGAFKDFT